MRLFANQAWKHESSVAKSSGAVSTSTAVASNASGGVTCPPNAKGNTPSGTSDSVSCHKGTWYLFLFSSIYPIIRVQKPTRKAPKLP